ncbi:hypothetical protein, partial [Streptomyces sp. NPDC023588]|uniref:hypothetical protein n=1 Tax=Streptomyces sp. NPDC023588 TaxID=3154907 RepID=UPI0033D18D88
VSHGVRVRLRSFIEFQGLLDLRGYVAAQAARPAPARAPEATSPPTRTPTPPHRRCGWCVSTAARSRSGS